MDTSRWALGQRKGAKTHYVVRDEDGQQIAACGTHFVQSDSLPLLDVHSVRHFACPRCVESMKALPVFTNETDADNGWDRAGHAVGKPLVAWGYDIFGIEIGE
jgi:hypothetical protein